MGNQIQLPFGRVWLGEFPEKTAYQVDHYIEHIYQPCTVVAKMEQKRATLMLNFLGAPGGFGWLGSEFIPDPNAGCKIQVGISKDEDVGLSKDYGEAVLRGSVNFLSQQNESAPCGIFKFENALQHPIDSSRFIFGVLAYVLMWLIIFQQGSISSETVTAFVRFVLKTHPHLE